MTQQEYENKIKELEKQIAELKMVKVEEPQSKRWEPDENEKYWISDGVGNIDSLIWDNDRYDNWHYLTGNCFKTKEEAEEYKKQIEYTARYKNYIEEHSEPLNWGNNNHTKYFVCFRKNAPSESEPVNRLEIDCSYWCKIQGVIYASSKQIIEDAIKEIGEDNFKKYVLGVK